MGDLNNCKPGESLGNFYQYVTCTTWLTKSLDLCYGSMKGLINPSGGLPFVSLTITCIWFHPTNLFGRDTSWNEDSFQFGRSLSNVSRVVTRAQIGISSQMHARVWMNSQRLCLIMLDFVRTQPSIKDQSPFFPTLSHLSINQSKTPLTRETFVLIKKKGLQKQVRKELKLAKRWYKDKVGYW